MIKNITVTNVDIVGVQYAAVLKNIYALGAGIAHGLDYGDNFLSVLIANSVIILCFADSARDAQIVIIALTAADAPTASGVSVCGGRNIASTINSSQRKNTICERQR